jgi:hypothetical protein
MGKLETNKQQKLTSLLNTAFNLFTTRSLKGKRKQLPDSVLSDDCTYGLEEVWLDSIYVSRFFIKNCAVAS